jgi:hypothetical protein
MTMVAPLGLVSRGSGRLARAASWAVVVLSPFRLRAILASHDVPAVWHDYTDLRVFAVDLAVGVLLVTWGASLLATHRRPARIPVLLGAPGMVLLGLVWAGVPGSLDPVLSAAGALELTAFAGLTWYVATEIRSPRDLALPVAVMVALQSTIALVQVAVQGPVGLVSLAEINLDPAASGIGIVASEDGVRLLRGYGLSDHPNILGGILAAGLVVLFGGLVSTATGRLGRVARVALALAAVLGVLALAVTFSRAAWIALVAAALAAAAIEAGDRGRPGGRPGSRRAGFRAARPWLALAGAVPLAVAALALPFAPFLAARLSVDANRPAAEIRSIDERVWLAGATLEVVAANPLLGTGLGTLPGALTSVPGLPYPPQPAHLVPLTIAAENGIPAALAFCLLVAGAMTAVVTRARRGGPAPGAAGTALGLLVVVAVVGCFDYYPWVFPAGRTWLAIALGAAVGLAGPVVATADEQA